jgi:hypothetical protein
MNGHSYKNTDLRSAQKILEKQTTGDISRSLYFIIILLSQYAEYTLSSDTGSERVTWKGSRGEESLEFLYRNSPGGTEESHDKYLPRQSVHRRRFKHETFLV